MTTRTLSFATETQAALFRDELVGQLSDGAWENATPADHWQAWADATVVVDPANVGRDFDVRKDGYAFAKQLIPVVGDRMIDIGKRFDPEYDEDALRADLAEVSRAMKTRTTFAPAAPAPAKPAPKFSDHNPRGTSTSGSTDKCRGRWSKCGGKNAAKSESWHLCQACTDLRKAARA